MSARKTLLDALFINPKIDSSRMEIYAKLQDRIFPSKDLYVKYLSTDDHNEQREIAKQLLQRLCFESHFSPPFSMLCNLLDFENDNINKSGSSVYIPQDHFQHSLNIYLLGIYIFFYQPQINKRLSYAFNNTRPEEGNPYLNATKDFISYWKYFCLFHDISYPLEAGYKTTKTKQKGAIKEHTDIKNGSEKFIRCFNSIPQQFMTEWIATIIANLIVVNDLLDDTDNCALPLFFTNNHDSFISLVEEKKYYSAQQIKENLRDYLCVDKVFNYDQFKLFSGFINEDDSAFLVYDLLTGEPVCIRFGNAEGADIYVSDIITDLHIKEEIVNILISEEPIKSQRYGKKFFIRNGKKAFIDACESIFPAGNPDETDLVTSAKKVLVEEKNYRTEYTELQCKEFSLIISAEDLDDYIYYYYYKAYSYIRNNLKLDDQDGRKIKHIDLNEYIEAVNKKAFMNYIEQKLADDVLNEVRAIVDPKAKELLQKYKDNKGVDIPLGNHNDVEKNAKTFVSNHFTLHEGDLINIPDRVAKKISDDADRLLYRREGFVTLYALIYNDLIRIFRENLQPARSKIEEILIDIAPLHEPSMENLFNVFDSLINNEKYKLNDNEKAIIEHADEKIAQKIPASNLRELYVKYINKKSNAVIDHGLMGSLLVLYSQIIAHCCIPDNGSRRNSNSFLRPLLWSISNNTYDRKLIKNYKAVFKNVFSAILCHNIYPEFIDWADKSKWVFNIKDDSCEYFGMLIDALQRWNRDKYYQGIDYTPFYSMDSYDICAEGKSISIIVNGYTRDIERLNNEFIKNFSYLENFSTLVKLSIES